MNRISDQVIRVLGFQIAVNDFSDNLSLGRLPGAAVAKCKRERRAFSTALVSSCYVA